MMNAGCISEKPQYDTLQDDIGVACETVTMKVLFYSICKHGNDQQGFECRRPFVTLHTCLELCFHTKERVHPNADGKFRDVFLVHKTFVEHGSKTAFSNNCSRLAFSALKQQNKNKIAPWIACKQSSSLQILFKSVWDLEAFQGLTLHLSYWSFTIPVLLLFQFIGECCKAAFCDALGMICGLRTFSWVSIGIDVSR